MPKTTLRLDDLLEIRTELWKDVALVVVVYYSERIQINMSKGKGHIWSHLGGPRYKFPVTLCQWKLRRWHLILSTAMCGNSRVLSGVSHVGRQCCVTDVGYTDSCLSDVKLTQHGSKPQVNKDTLIRQGFLRAWSWSRVSPEVVYNVKDLGNPGLPHYHLLHTSNIWFFKFSSLDTNSGFQERNRGWKAIPKSRKAISLLNQRHWFDHNADNKANLEVIL